MLGDRGWSLTSDLCLRRTALYTSELHGLTNWYPRQDSNLHSLSLHVRSVVPIQLDYAGINFGGSPGF